MIQPHDLEEPIVTKAMTTTLDDGSLKLSMTPYLFFRDPERSPAHLEIAVGVIGSVYQSGRQKTDQPVLVLTEIRVALAFQLPTHLPTMTYPLVVTDALRKKLMERNASYPAQFSLVWVREEVARMAAGWVVVENVFEAQHYMVL